ncbi:MAG: hypothetical protein CBC35_05865 [Planctomycetes bacterium TMED75]|nr:hypothetical protein [Planctomycetaceae bacterium]OUU93340.1 MAG: hypothetical protein CBC35_05865 [Planctomycetes bacterium TMED75]
MNTDELTKAATDESGVILVSIIFIICYVALAIGRIPGLRIDRAGIALVGAAAMLATGSMEFHDAMTQTDWSTVITLMALMVIVAQLTQSGLTIKVATKIIPKRLGPRLTLLLAMASCAVASALITNDVAILAFTPVLLQRLDARGFHPIPFLLGCTFAANIGSASTIIGNPQNMILAGAFDVSFTRHLAWSIVPVLAAFFVAWGTIVLFGEKLQNPIHLPKEGRQAFEESTYRTRSAPSQFHPIAASLGVAGLLAVIVLFVMPISRPVSVLCIAAIILLNRVYSTDAILGRVDWSLLALVVSLGVVVNCFNTTSIPSEVVQRLGTYGVDFSSGWQMTIAVTILGNLVNNIPAVLLLIKVVPAHTPDAGVILGVASTFAGNFIVVGSLANMIMVREAGKHGIIISFWRHARMGIPVTLLSLGILLLWIAFVG